MEEKVKAILDYFEQINAIPRCSKNEEQIGLWLKQWAAAKQLAVNEDAAGNLLVTVPPTPGYENAPVIVIQGHMDMVCEKSPDSTHDFSRDPIKNIIDGDWLRADNTTLGADNGIAIALAMAVAGDAGIAHPPLELLFTVDEETGLNGAKELEAGFIKGRVLLNVDSETEGVFTVGCAGGRHTHISRKLALTDLAEESQFFNLNISGLHGGHSGIDIIKQRASANKILARTLHRLAAVYDIQLVSIKGGTAHNAIARDAVAVFACTAGKSDDLAGVVSETQRTILTDYDTIEKNLAINLSAAESAAQHKTALSAAETRAVINLLLALPHGVMGLSAAITDLVETSNNLATVEIKGDSLQILTSQRSLTGSRLDEISATIGATAALADADTRCDSEYPPWTPNMQSALLELCQKVYNQVFDQQAKVKSVHAGLECAIIGDKYEGMDMISFGPDLRDPHSPNEGLYIPSLEKIWQFMVALLESYGSKY
ncbi:Cytosol nonspecific dipeptidase (EC [Olavius sp. associated proteobacterium Delta 1]|nr:Cytosol nonspecific dipeptidase (EC [Olavius sp. associated proteobacterium Delta 1]